MRNTNSGCNIKRWTWGCWDSEMWGVVGGWAWINWETNISFNILLEKLVGKKTIAMSMRRWEVNSLRTTDCDVGRWMEQMSNRKYWSTSVTGGAWIDFYYPKQLIWFSFSYDANAESKNRVYSQRSSRSFPQSLLILLKMPHQFLPHLFQFITRQSSYASMLQGLGNDVIKETIHKLNIRIEQNLCVISDSNKGRLRKWQNKLQIMTNNSYLYCEYAPTP